MSIPNPNAAPNPNLLSAIASDLKVQGAVSILKAMSPMEGGAVQSIGEEHGMHLIESVQERLNLRADGAGVGMFERGLNTIGLAPFLDDDEGVDEKLAEKVMSPDHNALVQAGITTIYEIYSMPIPQNEKDWSKELDKLAKHMHVADGTNATNTLLKGFAQIGVAPLVDLVD